MALLSVFILKAISSFLGVEGYGTYTAIYDFLAFFAILADLGLFTIAIREMGKGHRERDFIVGNILGMRILLATLAMSLAVLVAFLLPPYRDSFIPVGVAIASLGVFMNLMHGTVSSVLQLELKMQYSILGLVGGKFLNLAWVLAVVFWFFAGDPGSTAFYNLILSGTIGNFFSFLYTLFYSARYAKIRPTFNFDYWKEIALTATPYGLALMLNMIYFRIDGLMILFMKGERELGFYGPAVRILEILSVISVYFMNSILPSMSAAIKKGGEGLKELLRFSSEFLVMAALPILTGIFVLARPLIELIAEPEFLTQPELGIYGSDVALRILVFANLFGFLANLFTYSLVAVNLQSRLLWINAAAALLNVGSNFYFISHWGFRGAAFTSVVTEAFIFFAAFLFARKAVPLSFGWVSFLKTVFASGVMGGVVWGLEPSLLSALGSLGVLPLMAVGALVYFSLLWLTGAISKEFRHSLKA